MSHDLDRLLQQLAATPAAAPAGLDAAVLASVADRREDARRTRALAPVRVAAVGLAMAVGVAAGSAGAARVLAEPVQTGVFSAASSLAPSTLLEGHG